MYFKAIEKIGEQALQSSTSHMLGKALLHIIFSPVVSHSYLFLTFSLSPFPGSGARKTAPLNGVSLYQALSGW